MIIPPLFASLNFSYSHGMKKSKAFKRKDGDDMISNLPDPVLNLILSRLPTTEEVIRTSILSTRWRYLWTSVPSIDIDYFRGLKPHKEFKEKKFEEFVYRVLANNSLDLDSFRLCCANYYTMSTVGQWIVAAVRRNIKLLDLMFCPIQEYEYIQVPGCLFTCGSLEVLRLFLFSRLLRLPSFTVFPSLRVLELNRVVLFDDNLVEAFLKNCQLLEDLSLIDCWIVEFDILCISCPKLKNLKIDNRNTVHCEDCGSSSELSGRLCDGGHGGGALQISCPKLVFLELTGRITYDGYTIEGLDSLKKAVIHPEDTRELYLPLEMMATIICELFFGITHVESLSVSLYFVYKCMDPEVHDLIFLPDFYMLNLETLEITIDALTMDVLFQFLICSPYLESLYLIIHEDFFNPEYWQLEDPITRRILTRRLKRVEFREFNEKKWKLDVARCLLDDGHELEEMVFSWCDEDRFHERSKEIMKEVSKYYKASSTVKLISHLKN